MAISKCDTDWNQKLDNETCAIILAGKFLEIKRHFYNFRKQYEVNK